MKICIYGAGAIGGYMGGLLALTDVEVTLIARGPHLEAMRNQGLTLLIKGQELVTHPLCTNDPAEAGPQDYVIITLKAHSAAAVAEQFAPLLGPHTAVVTAVNGVPWWYFYRLKGPWENTQIQSVDPEGKQWELIGPDRAIGCVVYPACELIKPGVVQHLSGDRFSLGEPDGSRSERCLALSKALIAAGMKAPVRPKIRNDLWIKLWGNVAFNPISALTGATLDTLCRDPGTRAVARTMMLEAQTVAERLGVEFGVDLEARIEGAAKIVGHKTSMLQDLERGRPMEIDAVVGAVAELGRIVGVPTPMIEAIYALVRQRAIQAGCYPG